MCASLGGVFFLAFLAVGLFCLAKKKKKPVMIPAAECEPEHGRGGGEGGRAGQGGRDY